MVALFAVGSERRFLPLHLILIQRSAEPRRAAVDKFCSKTGAGMLDRCTGVNLIYIFTDAELFCFLFISPPFSRFYVGGLVLCVHATTTTTTTTNA